MGKNKRKRNGKGLIIAGSILLVLGIIYTSMQEAEVAVVCYIVSIVLLFIAFIKIRNQKKKKGKANAILEEAQKRQSEIDAHKKENREMMDRGLYPTFCKANYDYGKMIVADVETTGLKAGTDEILQLSVTDMYGNEIFNHYIKPLHKRKWTAAEEKHHISPELVKNEKNITAYEEELSNIFRGKTIVGYNIKFDAQFLAEAGLIAKDAELLDIMGPFAQIYGQYSERYGDYQWKKLTDCARYYHYEWEGQAHNALADCKATAYCFRKMSGAQQ